MQLDISDMPLAIRMLERDERGYPIPWFVHVNHGVPDFRVIARGKVERAVAGQRCWICGGRLGRFLAFVIGPMCVVNRISSEPPAHRDCAVYAARHCPFLTIPKMHRQYHDMPVHIDPAGVMEPRNPGGCAVWITRSFQPFNARRGNAGVLFHLGEPEEIQWYREGHRATRDEATAMLESGVGALHRLATSDGADAERDLAAAIERARRFYLPPPAEAA